MAEVVCPPTDTGVLSRRPVFGLKKQCAAVNTTLGQRSGTANRSAEAEREDIRELISSIDDRRSRRIKRVVDDNRGGRCDRGQNERRGAGEQHLGTPPQRSRSRHTAPTSTGQRHTKIHLASPLNQRPLAPARSKWRCPKRMHRARMADAGASRNATAAHHAKVYLEAPAPARHRPVAPVRRDCIQSDMSITRATGLVNSGRWVATAILESCGFHGTPDAVLDMSVIGTSRQFAAAQHLGRFRSEADIDRAAPTESGLPFGTNATSEASAGACRATPNHEYAL